MSKIVLITGANRGLGYSILEVAGPTDPSTTYVLCTRDLASGNEAKSKLESQGVKAKIDVIQLDVTNDDQILAAAKHVGATYGKLDVLVNNAGIIKIIPDMSLPTLRRCTDEMLSVNMTSVAIVTSAFLPLLQKAQKPRVINITSGLGSIERTLNTAMTRYPPYGFSKVGLNGVTAHMQAMENDRISKAGSGPDAPGFVRFYSVAPGLLKTAFNGFIEAGIDPKEGARAITHLIADDAGKYKAGTQLEFKDGGLSEIPW